MVCQQHHASRVKVEYKDAPSCLRVQAGCEYKYTSPCLRMLPGKQRAASRRDEGLRLVSGWTTEGIHPRIADVAVDVRVSAVSALCLFPLCRHARPNLHARYGIFGKGPSAVFVIPRLCGGISPSLLRLQLTHVHAGSILLPCLLLRPAGDTAYPPDDKSEASENPQGGHDRSKAAQAHPSRKHAWPEPPRIRATLNAAAWEANRTADKLRGCTQDRES